MKTINKRVNSSSKMAPRLRRTALVHHIPYYTTAAGARASVQAICALQNGSLDVAPLQSYFMGL